MKKEMSPAVVAVIIVVVLVIVGFFGFKKAGGDNDSASGIGPGGKPMTAADGEAMKKRFMGGANAGNNK